MALSDLKFTEGFDAYASLVAGGGIADKWTGNGGVTSASNSLIAGRFGGQAHRVVVGNFTAQLHRTFSGTANRVAAGHGVRFTSLVAASRTLFGASVGTTVRAGFAVSASGALVLMNNTTTVIATSATTPFVVNTWHTLEYELDATTAKAWVDGALVMDLTGLTLNMTGVDGWFMGQRVSAGGTLITFDIDDLWVAAGATASRVGTLGYKVETIRPNSDVTHDFAHSAGATGFGVVDETLVDSTDFNESSTLNAKDLFGLVDLSGAPLEILSVQVSTMAYRTDATFRNLGLIMNLGGVESQDTDWALPNSWAGRDYLQTTKPGGGSWTVTDGNALRAGYTVTL